MGSHKTMKKSVAVTCPALSATIVLCLVLFVSCAVENDQAVLLGYTRKGEIMQNDLLQSLRRDVENLATSEGRMIGTPGHSAAREYIIGRMKDLKLDPYTGASFELPYTVGNTDFINVIGKLPGTNPDKKPILLAAHYDTCGPYPGADDNAAAIAILLAAAPGLRQLNLERTVVFAFFDAEEPPCFLENSMGSIHFYNHQRSGPVHCAIVLDLMGHDVQLPGLTGAVFVLGMESDPGLEGIVRECEPSAGIRTLPTLNRYIGDMSDHHVFRINERPYLFLTCARSENYHRPTDLPDTLNYEKMAHVVDYVANLTESCSKTELTGLFEGYDTTETELYFMKKTLGPLLEPMGMSVQSRKDIETVVRMLAAQFQL